MIRNKHFHHITLVVDMVLAEEKGETYRIHKWTVDDWIEYGNFPSQFKDLPNAIAAKEIRNSPLYKQMQEEENTNGTEPNSEEET